MTSTKKTKVSKFISDDINDFINESQFLKESPKEKKIQKRKRTDVSEEEDVSKLIGQYQANLKKRKGEIIPNVEAPEESRQKLLDVMSHQFQTRKQSNENLLKNLSDLLIQLEADYNAMKENEQKLDHLTGAYMKCIQQATTAYKQKLKSLKDIHTSFKKESDDMETNHKVETDKLADELEEDIKKLQKKVISETKRNGFEALRRSIFQAMQTSF